MATPSFGDSNLSPDLYLSPDQQDLLRVALSSNKPSESSENKAKSSSNSISVADLARPLSNSPHKGTMMSNSIYASPLQQRSAYPEVDGVGFNESPFLDYDFDGDLDGNFDFDDSNGDQMIGALPGRSSSGDNEGDIHEKRKSIDGDDDDEGGGKRREGDDKTSKKPGRKPLTSEPTSKRKAQNRAAQRAFRERKERHLKDLETKVEDLEKASESTNHENGLLRAQVERLQTELKDYRKRLSAAGSSLGRSPPLGGKSQSNLTKGAGMAAANTYQFDFPRFDRTSTSSGLGNGAPAQINGKKMSEPTFGATSYKVPGVLDRNTATNMSPSSQSQRSGSNGASPPENGAPFSPQRSQALPRNDSSISNNSMEELNGLFSPSILQSVSRNSSFDYLSHNSGKTTDSRNNSGATENSYGTNPTPHLNGGSSTSVSASPSASSVSQHGPGSSAETSPEPNYHSPTNGKLGEPALNTINEEHAGQGNKDGQGGFYDSFNTSWNNAGNPTSGATPVSNDIGSIAPKTPFSDVNGIDWLAQQNGGQFDPVLFNDYRDPQDAVNSVDFGGFFDEALPLPDFGSPYNFNDTLVTAPRNNLLQQIDDKLNGDYSGVVPVQDKSGMLDCKRVW
ncbi:MAG: DNA-binding transcription factor yap1 [Candelina submexicana]|nr:MAG: DNA-binding transcription factor yap1 [Candelina submexicana]